MSVARAAKLLPLTFFLQACVTEWVVSDMKQEPDLALDTDPAVPLAETDEAAPLDDEPAPDPALPGDTGMLDPFQDDPPPADDCVGTSDLVYLVSRSDSGLYLFDPTTLEHTRLGILDCSAYGNPQSMAVARDGVAYVRWSDDRIYEVDLDSLDCSPTSYAPGAFGSFGMGFATDRAGTWRDQLYVANFGNLAQLDTARWSRNVVGQLPSQSELTGTSSGQLWAFLPLERPALLAEVDKRSGEPLQVIRLPSFPSPIDIDAFAFAHWGGDFYLFVRVYGMGSSSDVYRVDASGQMTLEKRRMGLDIVGAGTSTCAPTQ